MKDQIQVFGLTGGIGSGKSTVSQILSSLGECAIDADEISRYVVQKGSATLQKISTQFGSQVLTREGNLDRQALGRVVFNDDYKRKILESIVHPLIQERFEILRDQYQSIGTQRLFYEVPLLFENDMDSQFRATILVIAPLEDRIARVMSRNSLSETEVRKRISAQLSDDDKCHRATYIVQNDSTIEALKSQTERVHSSIIANY